LRRAFGSPVTTAAALVVAAFALIGWYATRQRSEPTQPTIRFKLTLPQGMRLGSVIVQSGGSFAVSPDGKVVAFVAVGSGSPQQLYVRGVEDVHPRVLTGTDGAGYPFFSPDGKSIGFVSNQVLKKTAVTGGGVITLTERLIGSVQGAAWGPDQRIVLSLGGKLMVIPESGGIPQPILDSASAGGRVARWPRVLPDGETVLFASSTGSNVTARIAIGKIGEQRVDVLELPGINPLGVIDGQLIYAVGSVVTGSIMAVPIDLKGRRVTGTPRQVIDRMGIAGTGGVQADLSASGTLMYQIGAAAYQAVLVDPNGATQTLIADPQTYGYVRFSPDGKRVAFTITSGSSSDVWIYDLASKTSTRLTTEAGQNDRPEWSPDGKRVLFRSARSGSGFGLWWQPYDGSGPAEPLVDIPGRDVWQGVMTRDAKTIVYRTGTVGTADLWYRSITGDTTSHPIANTPFTEWAPQLSPNDKWITYAADVSGILQVYVRPFPGPGALTQISLDGGDMPFWSRDGRRLFYVKNDEIVEATLSFDPVVSVTARATILQRDYSLLAGHATYDVAADDRRLLLLKAVGEAETIVAWNWRAELKNANSNSAQGNRQ
jgi:Tol biopolymer transport system component